MCTTILDERTLELIKKLCPANNYLLDSHVAVAIALVDVLQVAFIPDEGRHHSIEQAKALCEKVYLCDHAHLKEAFLNVMTANWDLKRYKTN